MNIVTTLFPTLTTVSLIAGQLHFDEQVITLPIKATAIYSIGTGIAIQSMTGIFFLKHALDSVEFVMFGNILNINEDLMIVSSTTGDTERIEIYDQGLLRLTLPFTAPDTKAVITKEEVWIASDMLRRYDRNNFQKQQEVAYDSYCSAAEGIIILKSGRLEYWERRFMSYLHACGSSLRFSRREESAVNGLDQVPLKRTYNDRVELSKQRRIIAIKAASEYQVDIAFSNGSEERAVFVYLKSPTLIQSCVEVIDFVSSSFLDRFYLRVQGRQWDDFVVCLMSFMHTEIGHQSIIELDDWELLRRGTRLRGRLTDLFELSPVAESRNSMLYQRSQHLYFQHHKDSRMDHTVLRGLLIGFHLVHESLSLDIGRSDEKTMMGELIALLVGWTDSNRGLKGYYKSLGFEIFVPPISTVGSLKVIEGPSILQWILKCITASSCPPSLLDQAREYGDVGLLGGVDRLRQVIELYQSLVTLGKVEMIKSFSLMDLDIDTLPIAVALPIRQAIMELREEPGDLSLMKDVCLLIGRKDLAFTESSCLRDEIAKKRFQDDRLERIRETFEVEKDVNLFVALDASMSVEEINLAQQSKLLEWAQRSFCFSLGKAMLNFDGSQVVPTEIFRIDQIQKSARISPLNSVIELSVTAESDVLEWPKFHMGVSAALKIQRDCRVESSWIVFNQSKSINNTNIIDSEHAGFIFGLGLTGHLKNLDSADSLRNYLVPQDEIVSTGHLLGLAVAHLGTRNPQITNMLSVHLPSMLPNHSVELNTGCILKTGAVVGYGLIHIGHPTHYKYDKILAEMKSITIQDSALENIGNMAYVIGCGFSIGFVGLGSGNLDIVSQLTHLSGSGIHAMSAAIALGMISLKTGNKNVLKLLRVPESIYLLNSYTPEILMVRAICYSLVAFHSIEGTLTWVESGIPAYIKNSLLEPLSPETEHLQHSYYSIEAGLLFALSLKFAASADDTILSILLSELDKVEEALSNVDSHYSTRLLGAVLRNCRNAVICSIGILMAGSGDLIVYKRLANIQAETGAEVTFGAQMAVNMALGMLFLASGSCTLGSSSESIAFLFCSFFPLFPKSSSDNKIHLQALRHMWVLAVEKRCLVTRDVDTGKIVFAPLEIQYKGGAIKSAFTPILMPDYALIDQIKVCGPRYWELVCNLDHVSVDKFWTIWVQRRTRYLSYQEDPHDQRGIMAASVSKLSTVKGEELSKMRKRFVNSFSSNSYVLAFVRHLCDLPNEELFSDFCIGILYECLSQDKPEMVSVYLSIYHLLKRLETGFDLDLDSAASLRCLINHSKRTSGKDCIALDGYFIDLVQAQVETYLIAIESKVKEPLRSLCSKLTLPTDISVKLHTLCCAYMTFYGWPTEYEIEAVVSFLKGLPNQRMISQGVVCVLAKSRFPTLTSKVIASIWSLL